MTELEQPFRLNNVSGIHPKFAKRIFDLYMCSEIALGTEDIRDIDFEVNIRGKNVSPELIDVDHL